jgi:hypothetical protein
MSEDDPFYVKLDIIFDTPRKRLVTTGLVPIRSGGREGGP